MKKSKILAFLTAFSMVSSLFVAFSANASAAANPTNDGLQFVAEYAGLDGDDYHVFNFKLEDPEGKLAAISGGKKYSGNVLDQIQIVVNFDEEIFDEAELYVTKTSAISGGLTTTSKDGEFPLKYAWIQSDYTATIATLPEDYIVSAAILTKGDYTEEEMLAGISFDGLTNCRVQYFDGTSKEPAYTTAYRVDGLGDYIPKTIVGEEAPVLPADRSKAVSFSADENTFVEITKGAEVKNYFLPAGVKGDATVYGLLKYTVDGTNVKSGDVFTIKAVDMETKVATDVASITVE